MSDIKIMNGENPSFSVSMKDAQVRYCTNAVNSHDALVEQNKALNEVINEIRAMVTDVQDGFDVTGGDAEILNVINDYWRKTNDNT